MLRSKSKTFDFLKIFRRFSILFLGVSVVIGSLSFFAYRDRSDSAVEKIKTREDLNVLRERLFIQNGFKYIASDLLTLSSSHTLTGFLDHRTDASRRALAEDLLSFCKFKGIYDQLRLLDRQGKEVVRVNFNSGKPEIVPDSALQFKGERYYFQMAIPLSAGEIYVSPFDLNIEKGKVEHPLKPMIRFATPVYDSRGRKEGVLVLNYLGKFLLTDLKRLTLGGVDHVQLLNPGGYWLQGMNRQDEWGFMFPEGRMRTFGRRFPAAWQDINSSEGGQFFRDGGLFTFSTVFPLRGLKENGDRLSLSDDAYSWKIVSYVPGSVFAAQRRVFLHKIYVFDAVLLVLFGALCWLLALNQFRHQQARIEERKLVSLIENSADFIGMSNMDEKIFYINSAGRELVGIGEAQDVSQTSVVDYLDEENYQLFREQIAPALSKNGGWRGEFELRNFVTQQPIPVEMNIFQIKHPRTDASVALATISRDISERKEMEKRLVELASTDGLTLLYNRGYFNTHFAEEFERSLRYKIPLALIILDIDHFKTINDTYGHPGGDAYLKAFAKLVAESVRKVDTVARYGGEELVVILPETGPESARQLAERLRSEVAGLKVPYQGTIISATISIGVAAAEPPALCSAEHLLRGADAALYAAKEGGRNRVCVGRPSAPADS